MEKNRSEYLRTPEAAEYVGLSRQYLEIARYRGDGPAWIRIGRAVRYRRSALDEWMMMHEGKSLAQGSDEHVYAS